MKDVALIFDIDGVIRDVSGSYRRALADTVAEFTGGVYRPSSEEIDRLKAEGIWNNDWEASQELIGRYFASLGQPEKVAAIAYTTIVEFFQSRYRGTDPNHWDGYIASEPLIATPDYFAGLTEAGICWGFFSGATRASAGYVLKRLGLRDAVLVAMEDAPGKPDPTGMFMAIAQLEKPDQPKITKVAYVGDTVADMLAVRKARERDRDRQYLGVGVIPPHVEDRGAYTALMQANGADLVFGTTLELTSEVLLDLYA